MKAYRVKIWEESGQPIIDVRDKDPVKLLDKVESIVKKFK